MLRMYGMKYRGFSPLCQPMTGLVRVEEDHAGNFHDILFYCRELTEEEVKKYELEYLGEIRESES